MYLKIIKFRRNCRKLPLTSNSSILSSKGIKEIGKLRKLGGNYASNVMNCCDAKMLLWGIDK